MKAVAYCRVSTNKDEQLDSLSAQERFFTEYAVRSGFELVGIYADEGKSGTKMKNRTELLKMLADARRGAFDTVLIKDVSRLARNTVDFLTSIRSLKALGIHVVFVNYDQTSSDSSEFMLTMLSAIAQEESANTSKRVKFGKRLNAEKGRVPNLVYGYDKLPGDCFTLAISESEAAVVRKIFDMYVSEGTGAGKIARELNARGLLTKRGCMWTQNAVSRILSNELYTGRIVNGRQEVEDFLTGRRRDRPPPEWLICERAELAIIEPALFERAARLLEARRSTLTLHSGDKHLFSGLLCCAQCGGSFRRSVRTYKNTYVKWVCAGRNLHGADFCENRTVIDEGWLFGQITEYFAGILSERPDAYQRIKAEYERVLKRRGGGAASENELSAKLSRLKKSKERYAEMYANELISMAELREKALRTDRAINETEALLRSPNARFPALPEDIGALLSSALASRAALARLIDKILVDKDGNAEVFIFCAAENVQNRDDCT